MSRQTKLINNIDRALSQDITSEWRDALIVAREEVLNRYPLFNSKSTLPITCPVCGTTREVLLLQLYNLKGMHECHSCCGRRVIPMAATKRNPDTLRENIKKVTATRNPDYLRESIKRARTFITPESRRESIKKMWQTRKSNAL